VQPVADLLVGEPVIDQGDDLSLTHGECKAAERLRFPSRE
jgi:hypothetical protein